MLIKNPSTLRDFLYIYTMEYIISLLVLQSIAIIYLIFRKREVIKEIRVEEKEYTLKYIIPDYKKVDRIYDPTSIQVDDEIVSKILVSLTEEYDMWIKSISSMGSFTLTRDKYRLFLSIDKNNKVCYISLTVGNNVDMTFGDRYYKYFQFIADTTYVEMVNSAAEKKCDNVNKLKENMLKEILTPEKLRLHKLKSLDDYGK